MVSCHDLERRWVFVSHMARVASWDKKETERKCINYSGSFIESYTLIELQSESVACSLKSHTKLHELRYLLTYFFNE